ncbi:unnamed protein product [Phytophthora fragariaefolia]|uniref:Unnamed protein product n=1 Tax=Phytophthora fragariaefolia TaxID=1490495 RepID=A0A9W6Y462_9STRA|nr:unnamed protein product [Phytophthora fragariaefolia]
MEQLSGLATPAFLTALNSWKEIVSKRLHAGASENSTDATTGPNEDNETDSVTSDDKSDVSPADLIDSMNFIRDIEQAVQLPIMSTAGSSSETTDTIQKTQREEKRANLAVSWNSRSSNTDLAKTPAMAKSSHLITRTKAPEKKKHYPTNAVAGDTQTRLSKTAKPQRLAVITLPDKNVPSLSRVLEWASNTIDRHHVSEILTNYPTIMNDEFMKARVAHSSTEYVCSAEYDYNFVISKCLVVKLDAVVKAEKNKRPKSTYFNSTSSLDPPDGTTEETIAYFLGGTPRFMRFVRIPCFLFRCLASVALNVAPANRCVA